MLQDLIAKLRAHKDRFVEEVNDLNDLKKAFKSQEAKLDAVLDVVDAIKEVQAARLHLTTRVKSVVALVCPDLEHTGLPIHDSLEEVLSTDGTPPRPKRVASITVSLPKGLTPWLSPAHSHHSSTHFGQESPGQPNGVDGDILVNQRCPSAPPLLFPSAPPMGSVIQAQAPALANNPKPPSAARAPLGLHSRAQRVVGITSGKGALPGQSGSMTTGSGSVSIVRSSAQGLIRVDPARLTVGIKRKTSFTNENLTSSKKPKHASTQGTSVKKVNQL